MSSARKRQQKRERRRKRYVLLAVFNGKLYPPSVQDTYSFRHARIRRHTPGRKAEMALRFNHLGVLIHRSIRGRLV